MFFLSEFFFSFLVLGRDCIFVWGWGLLRFSRFQANFATADLSVPANYGRRFAVGSSNADTLLIHGGTAVETFLTPVVMGLQARSHLRPVFALCPALCHAPVPPYMYHSHTECHRDLLLQTECNCVLQSQIVFY